MLNPLNYEDRPLGRRPYESYLRIVDADLTISALRALRRILRASDLSSRQLAAITSLTPSQLLILQEIAERGETTPTELANAVQFSQATITNICDRLQNADLVKRTRRDNDKRRVYLTATQLGRSTAEAAPDLLQTRFAQRFAELAPWEQAMIVAGLERVGDILGIEHRDAAPLLDSGEIDRAPERPSSA